MRKTWFPKAGLATANLVIKSATRADARAVQHYNVDNYEHLAPWEPLRDECYFELKNTKLRIQYALNEMQQHRALYLHIWTKSGRLIGQCCFSNIVYGSFKACYLGYSIHKDAQGKGLMYEALSCVIDFVFRELGLHRIMANFHPDNKRSEKLLMRLGFEREGYAKSYLKINGCWVDHVLSAKLNPYQQNDRSE